MATVIAKNITGSSVLIEDLGIEVDAAGSLNLSELFEFEDISGSDDLKVLVSNGTVIINDGVLDLSLANGLKHIYHQTTYEDSFEDGEIGGGITELSSVQVRRTTGLALLTSWQDVYFDTVDIENNTNAIEFSIIDKDRILIKETGHYLLYYSFTARSSGATRDCFSRIIKNDLTLIPGADTLQNLYQNETHQQSETAIVHLDDGDFITMQVMGGTVPIATMAGYVLHVTKLEGLTGAKGDPGEPGVISGSLELASLQIRRTTDVINLPLSAIDITFDTTDIETNSDILEHNNINPERINIKQSGTYFVTYSYEVDDECYSQILLNNSSIIPGSLKHVGVAGDTEDYSSAVNQNFIYNFTAGDFITFQLYASSTAENVFHDIIVTVHKLEGITGEKGDVGPQGIQGLPGPPGEASSINESGNLDEAKIADIENNSGASPTELFFYLVQSDNRLNNTIPSGISGDMATHAILYNGIEWSDIGPFIGIKGDKGDKGDTGDPGIDGIDGIDGKSVKVQKNDADIMSDISTLNFTGNVAVTTSPGSKVNIAVAPIQICQVYHHTGGTNLNVSSPIALPLGAQLIVDSYYTHSTTVNNSQITINTTGWYKVSYSLSYDGSNKACVHSYIRKNGTTKVILSDSYSVTEGSTNDKATNKTTFLAYLTTGNYIEILSEQNGNSATCASFADQCWIILEYIRGV